MFKISQDKKHRNLPDHIIEHLSFFPPFQIKFLVGGTTFFLLDLFILIPLIAPKNNPLLILIGTLLVLISLWALWIIVRNPKDTELESILFFGYLGAVGALSYFGVGLKYSYMIGITHPIYYIALSLLFLSSIYYLIRYYNKKFSSLKEFDKKATPKWHFTIAGISVPAGYIAANYFMGVSNFIMISFLNLLFFGLSFFFIFLLAKYFHKYFFMKANLHFVKFSNKKITSKKADA
ncbi:hypothetical protein J9317_02265 [Metabacillus sp. KIGAM252]|uniref:Uncharacterized protein n=1 Tax=Metabacillus flavus TaxID=2823519 RepID=A0ABS5LA54_9BACI|nr:hypothetical protein [Metabacillus flavus]MBS2967595.1 hypothetical protein [Metabacillus flavus]